MNARRAYPLLIILILLPFLISEKELKPAASPKPNSLSSEKKPNLKPHPDALRGLYMTYLVATDSGLAARKKREAILKLIEEKKINALVIDVKEVSGLTIGAKLEKFLQRLNDDDIYAIARFVLFADNSQRQTHPEWYLQTTADKVWRDRRGNSWLNPLHQEAQNYLIESAKKVAAAGFDEIQFDYIRYPADGALKELDYGQARSAEERFRAIDNLAAKLTTTLRDCCRNLRLSADVFGYITVLKEDKIIGQRLTDLARHFDYLSPMIYPSHYYKGLKIAADPARQLPGLTYGYAAKDLKQDVVNRPYETVFRSLLTAKDVLNQASSTAKLRPWLQAFDLPFDLKRGIIYDANKIYLQIKAADDAGAAGWLLWNASNVYNL